VAAAAGSGGEGKKKVAKKRKLILAHFSLFSLFLSFSPATPLRDPSFVLFLHAHRGLALFLSI
jgi:hypothetical protein